MDIASLGASPNADAAVQDVVRFGLSDHIVELDAYGFTVIPPEKMQLPDGFVDRLRDTLLRVHEERAGVELGDYRTAETIGIELNEAVPWWWLLECDDSVVEAALNPVVLAIARWMCGQSATLSATAMLLKAKSDPSPVAGLHNDTYFVPSPLTEYAHSINTSWILSDYRSSDDGPTVLVPGSHRFGRVPQPYEMAGPPEGAPWRMVPLTGEAGSLAVWHGNTWHGGGVSRREAGLRITLVLYWARTYMRPLHDWRQDLSPELVGRFPELKRILGLDHPYPIRGIQRGPLSPEFPFRDLASDPFA